jgi:hypothetical protein
MTIQEKTVKARKTVTKNCNKKRKTVTKQQTVQKGAEIL